MRKIQPLIFAVLMILSLIGIGFFIFQGPWLDKNLYLEVIETLGKERDKNIILAKKEWKVVSALIGQGKIRQAQIELGKIDNPELKVSNIRGLVQTLQKKESEADLNNSIRDRINSFVIVSSKNNWRALKRLGQRLKLHLKGRNITSALKDLDMMERATKKSGLSKFNKERIFKNVKLLRENFVSMAKFLKDKRVLILESNTLLENLNEEELVLKHKKQTIASRLEKNYAKTKLLCELIFGLLVFMSFISLFLYKARRQKFVSESKSNDSFLSENFEMVTENCNNSIESFKKLKRTVIRFVDEGDEKATDELIGDITQSYVHLKKLRDNLEKTTEKMIN